jgi:hypothetical protein
LSPICYIGEGSVRRIKDHKVAWLTKIARALNGCNGFEYIECRITPDVSDISKTLEKGLVGRFHEKFGELPLFNCRPRPEINNYVTSEDVVNIFEDMRGDLFSKMIASPGFSAQNPN